MIPKKSSGSLRQQAAAGGKWTALSAVASIVIQLLQLAALGRLLEPSDFGLMAMMMVVIGLATSLADFGVGNYIVQVDVLSRQLFWRLFGLGIGLALILSAVIAVAASWVAEYYQSPILRDLLPWLGLVVIASTTCQIYFAILQRSFKFKIIAVVEIISAFVCMVVAVGFALLGYGVWSLIVGQIAFSTAKTFFYLGGASQFLQTMPASCSGRILDALRFGYYQVGERLLNFAGWNLDKIIIGKLLGERSLGIYSVAFTLMMRPFSVLNPIFTRVSLPIFSQIKNDNFRLRRGYLDMIRTIALISFPVYLGLAIAAPAIVDILMGSKWAEAAPVVSVLCGLGLLFSLGNPIGILILAKGRPELAFYLNLVALLVYSIAYYVGSFFGIFGVSISFLIAAGLFLYPLEFYLRWKLVGMSVNEYFFAMKHHFIGLAPPLLLLVYFTFNNEMPQSHIYQLLSGIGGAGFFMGYLWYRERGLIKSTCALVLAEN